MVALRTKIGGTHPLRNGLSQKRRQRIAGGVLQLALCAVVLWVFFDHGLEYVNHGVMTAQEAGFPNAVKQTQDGRIPYRDFAFTEMPLSLYFKGLFLRMVGLSLIAGRHVNLALTLVALVGLVLVFRIRLARWEPGFAAAFAVACSPHWVSAMVQGTTAPAAMLFLVVAFGAVVVTGRGVSRAVLFALSASAAVLASLQAFPLVIGFWAVALMAAPGLKQRLLFSGLFLLVLGLAIGGWFLLAGGKFLFFNWTFMRASELSRHVILLLAEAWRISPGAILACLCGLVASPILIRKRFLSVQFLLVSCFVGMVAVLVPGNAYGKDVAPIVPFVAASGIVAVWATGQGNIRPFRFVFWIFPLIGLLYPWPGRIGENAGLEIEETARVLREMAPPGPVLTPLPIVALAASRELYPGTELGMFSVLSPKYRRFARELNMTTLTSLIGGVETGEPGAIVRVRGAPRLNFSWGVPDMQPQPRSLIREFERTVHQNFVRVHQSRSLEVFVRR